MKKYIKTIAFVFVFAMMLISTTAVQAAKPVCPRSVTCYYYQSDPDTKIITDFMSGYNFFCIKNLSKNAVITNIRSSNDNVIVQPRKYSLTTNKILGNYVFLYPGHDAERVSDFHPIYPKHLKSTKITLTVKQNKKTYKLSCNVSFKKAPNTIKKFTIGGVDYTKYANQSFDDIPRLEGKKKICIKPAAGFKIKRIDVCYYGKKTKHIKNNTVISMKDINRIEVILTRKKTPAYYKEQKNYYPTDGCGLLDVLEWIEFAYPSNR